MAHRPRKVWAGTQVIFKNLKAKQMKLKLFSLQRFFIALLLFFVCLQAVAQSAFIYHIGVGQGDATLMLLWNDAGARTSILIDAGNSKGKGDTVFSVCSTYLSDVKRIDYVIISHLHSDHMGGMAQVLTDAAANGWTVGYIFDRVAGNLSGDDDVLCYDNDTGEEISNDAVPAVPSSQLVSTYKAAVGSIAKIGWINLAAGVDILNNFPVSLGYPSEIIFRSLTSNGYVCSTAADYGAWTNYSASAHNENDYSYSFLLELGQFTYFTGGDIGGEAPYVDLETPLVDLFKTRADSGSFHFCTYKASHHGSTHSTNETFVNYTKPTVTIVPSALRSFSGTQLPGQETLDRIAASSANHILFYTYGWTNGSTASSGKVDRYRDVAFVVNAKAFAQNHIITINSLERNKDLSYIGGSFNSTTFACQKHGGTILSTSARMVSSGIGTNTATAKSYKNNHHHKKRKKTGRHKQAYHR
jgi:competence protein ComEC